MTDITKRFDIKNPHVSEFSSAIESNKRLSVLYDDEFLKEYATMINNPNVLEQDEIDYKSDKYINMELALPKGKNDEIEFATVEYRVTDENNLQGSYSKY